MGHTITDDVVSPPGSQLYPIPFPEALRVTHPPIHISPDEVAVMVVVGRGFTVIVIVVSSIQEPLATITV